MTDEAASKEVHALIDKIVAQWADEGKVIEGGWQAYVATSGLATAPETQRRALHTTYFLGAQHLWASIMAVMDPGADPTEKDLERMSLIHEELDAFGKSVLQSTSGVPPTTTSQTIGDGPIQAEYEQKMTQLAHQLDAYFNGAARGSARQTGFVLLAFAFDDHEGRCNYISNGADRKDIVTMFKEQIKRFEGSPDQTGRA